MAKMQVRTRVAAIAGGLAATALLAGPALTWGLDTTGITSATAPVTSTVQTVTDTVDQTTTTAVSTVDNTVQTTTAPVVQAVAPVVQQVASTVAPAPAAPTSTSAPAKTQRSSSTRSVSAPTTAVRHVAAAVQTAAAAVQTAPATSSAVQAATSTTAAVHTVRSVQRTVRAALPSSSTDSASPRAAVLPCDQLTALVPLGSTVQGLVTLLCETTNLALPARMGTTTDASPGPIATLVDLLGTTTAKLGSLHARAASTSRSPLLAVSHRAADRGSSLPGGQLGNGTHTAAAAGSATGSGPAASSLAMPPHHAAGSHPSAAQPQHPSGGLFGTHITGTDAVSLVLIACLVELAALLMWAAARRWVLPRFA